MKRVLVCTTLYPNAANPSHGVFVENRLRAILAESDIEARVIAPVPWFPSSHRVFGQYATFAAAPETETRHGIAIRHPRYPLPPKIGMTWAATALQQVFEKEIARQIEDGWQPDIVDAHYYYPDGVAAVAAAQRHDLPVVVTARGTDINLIPQHERQRLMILDAARAAEASITVCEALKSEMVNLGADPSKITVLRNGVDLGLFRPMDRVEGRAKCGLPPDVPLVASVGHLIARKGHDLAIDAIATLPEVHLAIAGDGPEEKSLRALVARQGVGERVHIVGRLAHEDLPLLYSAADCLLLASSREGWPNVLLEAMACGTPAVAPPIWGCGEVITAPEAGQIATARSVDALASSVRAILETPPEKKAVRAYAEQFDWSPTAKGVLQVFDKAIADHATPRPEPDWQIVAPFELPDPAPALLVTVDTEEIFDWADPSFKPGPNAPVEDIAKFQALCEAKQIRPLYFLTYPLITDPAVAPYFADLASAGTAHLGLHLHAWVTPPLEGPHCPFTSYQSNLPPALHAAKLDRLIAAFEDAFGFRPIAHRAGRYGVAPHIHEALAERDVYLDFSPSAHMDLRHDGGPDFTGLSARAWIAEFVQKPLMCLPVTGKRALRRTGVFLSEKKNAPGDMGPLNAARKELTGGLRLTPEGFGIRDLTSASASLAKDGIRLQSFSLHSTTLTPGATPYARNESEVVDIIEKSGQFFDWFINSNMGRIVSLDDIDEAARRAFG